MGVWGTSLFSDDVACDVRDHYRELLEDGAEDSAATQQTVEKFRTYLDEPEGIALLALAVTQSTLGRLDSDIRDRALAVIDRGADLEVWERENPKQLAKRRGTLEKARAQLLGPQPPRRRLRAPKRISSGLAGGDVLALALPRRIVHSCAWCASARIVSAKRRSSRSSTSAGPRYRHQRCSSALMPEVTDPIALMHVLSQDTRIFAFVMQRVDWQGAGFQKVATISTRDGDEKAAVPSSGISWTALAERYRRRSEARR